MTTLLAFLAIDGVLNTYQVVETVERTASVYSDYYIGRTTSYGEIFSQEQMTVATWEWPKNTWLKLTHPNGNTCFVRVTDRNHRKYKGRWIDLARKAWLMLEEKADGLHRNVKVEVIEWNQK